MNVRDVQTKIDLVVDNLQRLRQLPVEDYDTFVGDFRNSASALHLLQTSVQALIDIAAYVASNLGLRTPASSVDVIEVLRDQGLVGDERAAVYVKMVQLRDRVVHLHNRIDMRMVHHIVAHELGDIKGFLERLLELIEQGGGPQGGARA